MTYNLSLANIVESSDMNAKKHTDVNCPTHINFSMEIVYVFDGELVMQISEKTYTIRKNQAIFVLPFEKHSFYTPIHSQCTVIMFPASIISDVFEFVGCNEYENRVFALSEELNAFAMAKLNSNTVTLDPFHSKALLVPFAIEISDKCKVTKRTDGSNETFFKLIRLVNENYSKELTAADYAKLLGVHPVTISRVFSKNAGISFNSFCNAVKISNAMSFLQSTNMTVSEVAFNCGFGSIRSFNRNFQKSTGESPLEYRRKILSKINTIAD